MVWGCGQDSYALGPNMMAGFCEQDIMVSWTELPYNLENDKLTLYKWVKASLLQVI